MAVEVLHGDSLAKMYRWRDETVDAIICDPPHSPELPVDVHSVQQWHFRWASQALRILKPGGHLIAFAKPRTYHRLVCGIEDSGFQIRDMIAWLHDVGAPGPFGGLRPALEPCVLARKPLEGNVIENVEAYRTGALNIEACRITTDESLNGGAYAGGARPNSAMGLEGEAGGKNSMLEGGGGRLQPEQFKQPQGRWPANVIHDGSSEVVGLFPVTKSGEMKGEQQGWGRHGIYGEAGLTPALSYGDEGSAARFFYSAPHNTQERNTPSIKPVSLLEYLLKLVTPKRGIVVDPFCGTGTTLIAALNLGINCIGIEQDKRRYNSTKALIERAKNRQK